MGKWVRVSLPGVGKWTQSATAPLPKGAQVVDEPAEDGAHRPLPDEPDAGKSTSKSSKEA